MTEDDLLAGIDYSAISLLGPGNQKEGSNISKMLVETSWPQAVIPDELRGSTFSGTHPTAASPP